MAINLLPSTTSIIDIESYELMRKRIKLIDNIIMRNIYSKLFTSIRTVDMIYIGKDKSIDEILVNITIHPVYSALRKEDYKESVGLPNLGKYYYHNRITDQLAYTELIYVNEKVSDHPINITIPSSKLLTDTIINKILAYEDNGKSFDSVKYIDDFYDNKTLRLFKLYYNKKTAKLYGVMK